MSDLKPTPQQCGMFYKYRELLLLAESGLKQKEIADQTSVNFGTVRSYFLRLRKAGVLKDNNKLAFTEEQFKEASEEYDALEDEQNKPDIVPRILAYIKAKGRTLENIKKAFHLENIQEVKSLIEEVKDRYEDTYSIYQSLKPNHELVTMAVPDDDGEQWRQFEPREFKFSFAPNHEHPYLLVNMPDDIVDPKVRYDKEGNPKKKLQIIPIGDLHYGAVEFDSELFDEYLEYVKNTPNAFVVLIGDLIENSNKQSVADGVYRQFMDPQDQCIEICKMFAPIQHKILGYVRGNHEKRSRQLGLDPGRYIADVLEVPYYTQPFFLDIVWCQHRFSFYVWHGRGSSRTEGGRLNAAINPVMFTDFTHFYLSGHVHDQTSKKKIRIVRSFETFQLENRKQYICICPAFLKYFGTYAAEAGYSPPSAGAVSCELFSDGDYHLSE